MTIIIRNDDRAQALRTANSLARRISRLGYPGLTKSERAGAWYSDTITIQTHDFTEVAMSVSYWTAATVEEMLTPAMKKRAYVADTNETIEEYVSRVNAYQN